VAIVLNKDTTSDSSEMHRVDHDANLAAVIGNEAPAAMEVGR